MRNPGSMALLILLLPFVNGGHAETLTAAFEPLPPHIDKRGGGLVRQLFDRLEARTGVEWVIEIMPYSRAKRELLNGRVDLAGFTPMGREVDAFYENSLEIRWPYPAVNTDFVALNPEFLAQTDQRRIGTPYGNEAFAAQMLDIPIDNFYLATLDQLVLMLLRGRLDLVWFERVALHRAIDAFSDRPTLYYRQAPAEPIAIGLAVRRDPQGKRIKQLLEREMGRVELPLLPEQNKRLGRLPDRGTLHGHDE